MTDLPTPTLRDVELAVQDVFARLPWNQALDAATRWANAYAACGAEHLAAHARRQATHHVACAMLG